MPELEAGRELDALIEERIFGNAVDHEFDEPMVKARRDQYDEWGFLPAYSTDIAAAWEVVEHLRAQGWSCSLYTDNERIPARVELMFIREPIDDTSQIERDAETMPLAICRAALAAVSDPNPF